MLRAIERCVDYDQLLYEFADHTMDELTASPAFAEVLLSQISSLRSASIGQASIGQAFIGQASIGQA